MQLSTRCCILFVKCGTVSHCVLLLPGTVSNCQLWYHIMMSRVHQVCRDDPVWHVVVAHACATQNHPPTYTQMQTTGWAGTQTDKRGIPFDTSNQGSTYQVPQNVSCTHPYTTVQVQVFCQVHDQQHVRGDGCETNVCDKGIFLAQQALYNLGAMEPAGATAINVTH
jgi:hypothetical protein